MISCFQQLRKRASDCIELIGIGQATGNLYEDSDPLTMATTSAAAARAFAESSKSPQDIEIAELQDCFTISEILMMEAIGFSEKVSVFCGRNAHERVVLNLFTSYFSGNKGRVHTSRATRIDGRLPINTVRTELLYKVTILQRFCIGWTACWIWAASGRNIGLPANMGGNDKTSVVSVFRNIGCHHSQQV